MRTQDLLLSSLLLAACANEPESDSVYLRTAEGVLRVEPIDQGDGWFLVHGDILVREDELERNRVALEDLDAPVPYAAIKAVGEARWEDGRIPFRLHADLSDAQRDATEDAIAHWHATTPYRFVAPSATDTDIVTFTPGNLDGTCASAVGRVGGAQTVEVDTCSWGRIAHEIGHTVGFFHEQSRVDRDSYVTIHWDNITESCAPQFETYVARGRDGQDLGPYDYGSIMHYSRSQCSNGNGDAITPKQSTAVIGQRDALSMLDRYAAEAMYYGLEMTPSTGAVATVHRDALYRGVSQTFGPGHYRALPSNNMLATVGDDQASSVRVPAGLSVRVCTGAGLPDYDVCQTLAGSTSQLPVALDNRVSTVDVERAVTVYRDANLVGTNQTFRVGTYAANLGQLATIGNDQVSSLVVPPGLVAELCWSESGSGSTGSYCQTYEGTVNFVGSFMDNQTSLIRVKRAVTLFQEAGLWGNRKSFPTGTWTSFSPVTGISSLAVGNGLQVIACAGASGGSPCATFRGDVTYVGPELNDKIRWLRVESNQAP